MLYPQTYLITGSLHLLTTFTHFDHLHPFSPTPSTLIAGSHHSVLGICEFSFGLSFDSTCKWNHVYVCSWLISLGIIPLAFIHVVTNDRIFFFCKGWIIFYCLCMCIPHFLSTCSLMDPAHFHALVIVDNAAVNVKFPITFWVSVFVFFG